MDLTADVVLRWRAFQLDPQTPRTAQPALRWLGARYGGEERARQMLSHVSELLRAEDLVFDVDRA